VSGGLRALDLVDDQKRAEFAGLDRDQLIAIIYELQRENEDLIHRVAGAASAQRVVLSEVRTLMEKKLANPEIIARTQWTVKQIVFAVLDDMDGRYR
jgi:hypothetical protein